MVLSAADPAPPTFVETTLIEQATERAVAPARHRASAEVHKLIDAAYAVIERRGTTRLTVAEVLREAELSTRAFYRHFAGKDDLVLAVFEREHVRAGERLAAAIEDAPIGFEQLHAWIDAVLALGYDKRRARRTTTMLREGARLRDAHPSQFDAMVTGLTGPLIELLERGQATGAFPGAQPELDAASIHALTWDLAQRALGGASRLDAQGARFHVLRFATPALVTEPHR